MLKEPEIKLFGRKISLPENGTFAAGGEYSGESGNGSVDFDLSLEREVRERSESEEKQDQGDEDQATGELCETTAEDVDQNPEDSQNPNASSESDDNPPNEDDNMSKNQLKPENGQQKTLKKPDKILPCPRCSSMDTKFCYYNNYNVNQPRHFCKSCQRYWTAGGTMRNVPVGAGRRKNKNSGSHCHHITISEALQAARTDTPNGFRNIKFSPNGTVLSFGPDSPLCESVASALNMLEKRVPNGVRNREDDCTTRDGGRKAPAMQNGNGFPSPVLCIPGVPWPFPWNSAFPIPAICPPGYPLPYYPAPFWNCGVPNAWNVPWLPMPSPTPHQKGAKSGPSSPLGKHSRNGELIHHNKTECKEPSESSSIVVPKTLRIDDPEEAAKSSIWSTLGIKCDAFRREGLFKALQPKGGEKKPMANPSPLLQANPAALSRSMSFQERA